MVVIGLVVLTTVVVPPGRAEAAPQQQQPQQPRRSTPQLLEEAVARGEIDRATADAHLVEIFVGRGRSGKVPARFQGDAPWDGTMPLLRLKQRLNAQPESETKARTLSALAVATSCLDSNSSLPNETTSAHFYVNYGTIGAGLTVNSYINSLETSYATQVGTFGWASPPAISSPAPIGTKYPVRIAPLTDLFGFVATSGTGAGFVGNNPNTPWDDQDAYASCMVLNSNYTGYSHSPQQALDATTAHEYNHSIQFGYGAIAGGNVPDNLFFEGGASWMEDEVFDAVNDNYNYLWPNFKESLGDYDQLRDGADYAYPSWLMLRGLTERFGTGVPGGGEQVMQDFWENTSKNIGNNLGALGLALQNKGVSLATAYHDFAIAAGFMRTCGGGYTSPHCFEEAAGYLAQKGGALPPVDGSIPFAGGSFLGTVDDDYALAWVTLPASGAFSLTLSNTALGGQLRGTTVCDTGTTLIRTPFPAVVGAGASASLSNVSSTNCLRRLAVITNEQQSPGNPSTSPSRSFTLSTGAPSPNTPPVANQDSYSTFEGTPLTIPAPGVLANDTDVNGNPPTATLPAGQVGGTVSLNPNGSFTFTPAAGFTGSGGFSYTANDGNGGTDTASVVITVSPRPTYVPLTPARLLDTRPGGGTVDGLAAGTGAVGPGGTRNLQVTGRGGVPITPVGAVALNITVTGPTVGGFLTVYPTRSACPHPSGRR